MFQVEREAAVRRAEQHAHDVAAIQQQLIKDGPASLGPRSGRSVSHMTSSLTPGTTSTHSLRRVIEIDPAKRQAWVEPGVTMEELVASTLNVGMMPCVVPEFRSITVGGAVMGAALESASFHCGQFSDCVESYELLLADGTLLEASASEHPELFYGVSGSYGSLATLVSTRIHLKPAEGFVRLEYREVIGTQAAVERLVAIAQSSTSPDFLDAMAVSPGRYILMSGRKCFRDEIPRNTALLQLQAPWAPWFCQHVLAKPKKGNPPDYLSLTDYLFRYDRGAFWMGQFVTSRQALWRFLFERGLARKDLADRLREAFRADPPILDPSLFFRVLTSWKLSSRQFYSVLHALPQGAFGQTFVVQDFYIPVARVAEFLTHVETKVRIFPLWLCPIHGTETPQILSPHYLKGRAHHTPFDFINVGVYGVPIGESSNEEVTIELESLASRLGGRKVLYAINYQTKEQFWADYDRQKYEELRQRYRATGLMDFYERTHLGGKP